MISRWRYSPEAHEALNSHVNGLISGTHSVADVRSHIEESQENEGTSVGLAPGSIDGAKAICKDVLKTRLRESAQTAIFAGRKGLQSEHLGKFGASLADAQACTWLDDEVSFKEFEVLLRNFQVRTDASRCFSSTSVESLIEQLQGHLEPPVEGEDRVSLTDVTLTMLLHSLLAMMQRSPEVYDKLVVLGIVDIVSRLFLAEGLDYKVQAPNPDFPEVQMCLAQLLAEVALQSARECSKSVELDPSAMRAMQLAAEGPADRHPPAPPEPPPISEEAQLAIKTLLVGLKESLRRKEHAPVWAVISALHRLAEQPFACQQLLKAGFLPVLRAARQNYAELASSSGLPLAIPRPKPRPPTVTKEVPSFVGAVAEPPALYRAASTAKDRVGDGMLRSLSSPEMPRAEKRLPAAWLCGTPAAKNQLKRHKSQKTQLAKAGRMAMQSVEETAPFPSLLWLIGEDSVDKESFYRVCDRSFMLLQLQRLLRTVEEAQRRLAQHPYQSCGRPPPSGGIMGNRPDSRSGIASFTGTGRLRPPPSTLAPPAKGSDMYDQRHNRG